MISNSSPGPGCNQNISGSEKQKFSFFALMTAVSVCASHTVFYLYPSCSSSSSPPAAGRSIIAPGSGVRCQQRIANECESIKTFCRGGGHHRIDRTVRGRRRWPRGGGYGARAWPGRRGRGWRARGRTRRRAVSRIAGGLFPRRNTVRDRRLDSVRQHSKDW